MAPKTALRVALAVVSGLLLVTSSFLVFGSPETTTALPACSTEDDTRDCVWDAQKRGNGKGESFIHYQGQYYYQEVWN